MAETMRRLPVLTVLLLGASLGACASQPTLSPPPMPVASGPVAPTPDPGTSPYGLFLAGQAAQDEGHLVAASAYLGRAAATESEPGFIRNEAFNAALRAGDIPAAAALAPTPDDVSLSERHLGAVVRGVEALAEGKPKDAYAQLSGPEAGFPHKGIATLLAPFAAAGAGDAAHALARPDMDGDGVGQFVADLDQAELYERLGKPAQAEAAFKTLMQGGDQSGLITVSYGAFLERRGRWADAQALYRERGSHDPNNETIAEVLARAQKHGRPPSLPGLRQRASEAMLIPAAALIAQKQQIYALDYLRLALRLDPANNEAWILVGDLLAPADPEAARAALVQVAPSSDRYVAARDKLAWTYQRAGDQEQALKIARETLTSAPGNREVAGTLADLLRADEQYAESATVLTKLIDGAGPKPDWRLFYLRASAYDQLGDTDKTEADLAAALKLEPDEPELLNFQAYFWIDRGQHLKEALAMVQRAADADPQSGEIIDSLGWAYYRLGDFPSAVEKLEQAVTLEPAIAEVNDHLGDAYWRVGRRTEAEFQWRRVLSLNPSERLRIRAEAKLASPSGPDVSPAPLPLTSAQ
ncbi:MAG TPA: tetratricopeptide repeat protein [Caulobacteraceae bacterium]|jgi:Flp pilus assembly protein TadD